MTALPAAAVLPRSLWRRGHNRGERNLERNDNECIACALQFVEAGGMLMENATFKGAEVTPGVGVKLRLVCAWVLGVLARCSAIMCSLTNLCIRHVHACTPDPFHVLGQ